MCPPDPIKKDRSYFQFLFHVFRSKHPEIGFKDTTPCCPTKTQECNAIITAALN